MATNSPIAEAFILVRPDLTGFKNALVQGVRSQINNTAQQNVRVGVVLAPGAKAALRKDIASTASKLTVGIGLASGVKTQLREELATKVGILPLPVMPTIAPGAKGALQQQLRELGLTTTVKTTGAPAGTSAAAATTAAAAAGGTSRVVKVLTEEAQAARAKAAAVTQLNRVQSALNKIDVAGLGVKNQDRVQELRLVAVRKALTATTNALGDATAKLTRAEQRSLESTVKKLRKDEETLVRQIDTRNAALKAAADQEKTARTQTKTKEEQDLKILKDRAAATASMSRVQVALTDAEKAGLGISKETAALDARLRANKAAQSAINKELTKSTLKLSEAERAQLQTSLRQLEVDRAQLLSTRGAAAAREQQAAEQLKATQKAQTAQAAQLRAQTTALTAVTTRLTAAQLAQAGEGATLVQIERELTAIRAAEGAITRTLARETLGLDAAQKKQLVTEQAALRARTTALLGQKQLADNARDTARSLGQAQRGVIATSATFAGLRGAVLAASTPFILATIAVTAFGKAIQSAAQLEENLAVFRATTGATLAQMEAVSAAATALGKDLTLPSVTASDAAGAMVELAKAGLTASESIAAAKGVLQLATAAAIGNAEATQLAASALNAFGLAGDQAIRVADVLANSANAAQGSIVDMGTALQQSAAVARQSGISLEDTASLLTLLARNGLRGSDAGTSLRTALIRLTRPTKEANAAIQQLGLEIRDAQGNIRPEVFAEFGELTASLPKGVRDAVAALIFGQDAIRATSILAREGAEGLDVMQESIGKSGTAADLAAARMSGLRGAVEGLSSNLNTLGTQAATVVVPGLTAVVKTLNALLIPLAAVGVAFAARFALLGTTALVTKTATKAQAAYTAAVALGTTAEKGSIAAMRARVATYSAVTAAAIAATNAERSRFAVLAASAGRGALGLVGGPVGAAILGITALSAAVGFLITRDSELESATKKVGKAFDEATAATDRHKAALDAISTSAANVRQLQQEQAQAFVALAAAQREAQESTAATGSLEEIRVTNALGEAKNNLLAIQQRLGTEQENLARAGREAENAAKAQAEASRNQAKALVDEINLIKESIAQRARSRGAVGPGQTPATPADIDLQVTEAVTAALEQQAEAAGATSEILQRNIELVQELFLNLATQGRTPTLAQVELVLNNQVFNATLDQILARKNKLPVELELTSLQTLTQGLEATLKLVAQEGLANALPGTREAVLKMVQELNKLGPEGSEVVARNARALGDLFATNFSESAARALDSAIEAVEDANQRVRQAIEQSNEAVESSVRQAISNVRSLGQQLGDDFSKLVDAGPLGRQIDALQAKLDKLRGQSNMDDLLEAQRKARLALREKEESIFVEGPITPSVQQDIDNFLAPERADLRRANQAITIARTETQLSSAEKAVQTLKDNTTKGIDDAIAQFENGTITLGELNATLARKLKLDAPLYKAAGKTLGAAFQRDFSRHLNTIRAQFDALRDAAAAGIDVKITVDDIAEPAVVQQEGVRNIRRAREDLADAIAAKSKAEARLRAAQKTNKLLQTQINIARNAARNKPKTKPKSVTETGPPKTGNLPGQRPVN